MSAMSQAFLSNGTRHTPLVVVVLAKIKYNGASSVNAATRRPSNVYAARGRVPGTRGRVRRGKSVSRSGKLWRMMGARQVDEAVVKWVVV